MADSFMFSGIVFSRVSMILHEYSLIKHFSVRTLQYLVDRYHPLKQLRFAKLWIKPWKLVPQLLV